MKLEDLTGRHELSGVDSTTMTINKYDEGEQVEAVLFILDDVTYAAIEDPGDGYRSYLEGVEITDKPVINKFPAHTVIGAMSDDPDDDLIRFTDVRTGKIVLEIGTENTNDYYPYCRLHWSPENLFMNVDK